MQDFPKRLRVLKRREFVKCSKTFKRLVGSFIILDLSPNQLSFPRLGIIASRHFGKSHERNRFKRLVRESFRLSKDSLKPGFEYIVKPRKNALNASMMQIKEELVKLQLLC